jgi:hypothetical protein
VVEGARLESVFTGNRNVGSNPTPSATVEPNPVTKLDTDEQLARASVALPT